MIRNCTLDRAEAEEISVLGYLDCLNTHLSVRHPTLHRVVASLHGIYIEKCNLRGAIEINGEDDDINNRLALLDLSWGHHVRELGDLNELNNLDLTCSPHGILRGIIK
jgi:hypothetical protein